MKEFAFCLYPSNNIFLFTIGWNNINIYKNDWKYSSFENENETFDYGNDEIPNKKDFKAKRIIVLEMLKID